MEEELTSPQIATMINVFQNPPKKEEWDMAHEVLVSITNQPHYLPNLIQIVEGPEFDLKQKIFAIQMIDKLFTKKGSLLQNEELLQFLQQFLEIYSQKCRNYVSTSGSNFEEICGISKVISKLYRLFADGNFIINGEVIPPFEPFLNLLASLEPPFHQTFLLLVIQDIVDEAKDIKRHLTSVQQRNFTNRFYMSCITPYLEYGIKCVNNSNACIQAIRTNFPEQVAEIMQLKFVKYSVITVLNCLTFKAKPDSYDMYKIYLPQIAGTAIPTLLSPEFTQSLFYLLTTFPNCDNDNITQNIFELIHVWIATIESAQFIPNKSEAITEIARCFLDVTSNIDHKYYPKISRIYCKIVFCIPPNVMASCNSQVFEGFYNHLLQFSSECFKVDQNVSNDETIKQILRLWENSSRLGSSIPFLQDKFQHVFLSCFDFLMEEANSLLSQNGIFGQDSAETVSKDLQPLWSLALISQDAISNVSGRLRSYFEALIGWINSSITPQTRFPDPNVNIPHILPNPTTRPLQVVTPNTIISQIFFIISFINTRIQTRLNQIYPNLSELLNDISIGLINLVIQLLSLFNTRLVAFYACPSLSKLEEVILEFAKIIRRDYLSRTGFPILQKARILPQALFDSLINHFISVLLQKVCDSKTQVSIISFIDESSDPNKSMDLQEYAKANEGIQKLVQRNISIDIPINDPQSAKQPISSLNQMISRTISGEDAWAQFLKKYDDEFAAITPQSGDPPVFLLYCQLNGVLKGISTYQQFLIVVRWYLSNHVQHTIQHISTHPNMLNIISHVWHLLCSNKGKKLMFPQGSAEGITLFKASLQVVNAILSVQNPNAPWYALRIVKPCLTEKYANFGIMKFFGDNDADAMMARLMDILEFFSQDWNSFSENQKMMSTMLAAINALIEIDPNVISSKMDIVLNFFFVCLRDYVNRQANQPEVSREIWRQACSGLSSIIEGLASSGNTASFDTPVMHALLITMLDGLINADNAMEAVAVPLFYFLHCNQQYANDVMGMVLQTIDARFQESVQEIMKMIIDGGNQPVDQRTITVFRNILGEFKKKITRYAISLAEIPPIHEQLYGQ